MKIQVSIQQVVIKEVVNKMNGILLIDKEKGCTSRDVVNNLSKKLNIKKIGHAGTLDPIATGLLIIGVGKGTKIMDLLTLNDKEYIATVKMGILTDTMDITGKIVSVNYKFNLEYEKLNECLKSFEKKYYQSVPIYSAVKINGKKLYEYARNNIQVELPKRMVDIKKIELLDYDKDKMEFTFKALVSKGTYIRSLIKDMGDELGIYFTMKELRRIKSGKFRIEDSNKINDNLKFIAIKDALDIKSVLIEDLDLLKKVLNGNKIIYNSNEDLLLFLDSNNRELAIYQKEKNNQFKPFKVF